MRAFLAIVVLALCACGAPAAPEAPAAILARAVAASPQDARLAELYDGACRACHAQADTGAPLALDRAAWDGRWSKGEQTLLDHTISGFNGMPAGGQCFACTADDYRALIRFMAGREE
ncbi:MAG: c-type cytochrome [Hyphomonadaceae bacterium]|nr:c-type cytochrome [Hyphomonadaceae bacterium]